MSIKNKRKNEDFLKLLKLNYSLSWKFIKDCRKSIFLIVGVFFAFSLLGFFVQLPDSISQQILKMLQEIIAKTEGLSSGELIRFIFLNNLQSSFFGIILGVFAGIFPIFFSAFNGYILGFVSSLSVNIGGIGVLWKLLPHGIFELPAVFIALGIGLELGILILTKRDKNSFKNFAYNSLRTFLLVIIPLLLIAAVIEGFLIFFIR